MKEMGVIKGEKRADTNSSANRRLRKSGYLPASIFGKGIESASVVVKKDEFVKVLSKFGRNSVFKLDISGDTAHTVIVKEIQSDPIGKGYLHIGFQQISLSEEIKTDVSIRILGSELIEAKRLVVIHQMSMISVKGLPQNIPDVIEINVSNLQAGENINVGSIKFPEGIVSENDPKQVVVSVSEPKRQEIEETAEKAAETEKEEVQA
ncbi:MAG: 50S ribosomal protein L25 [Clostridiaceae bacterium]